MSRRKRAKTSHADKRPSAFVVPAERPGIAVDFRAGLVLFVLTELGTYVTLAHVAAPWLTHAAFSAWRNAFLVTTAVILGGVVLLWLAGARSRRLGWIIVLAATWLAVLTVRLVPLFIVGGTFVPALLALFFLQLSVALMVPAAAREARRSTIPSRSQVG